MNDNSKKLYKVSFLSRSENGAALMVGHLTRFGAEIQSEGNLRKVKLEYPIDKETSAHFGCINCALPTGAVSDIQDTVRLDKEIMRMLILSPSPVSGETKRLPTGPLPGSLKRVTRPKVSRQEEPDKSALSNELLEEKLEEILK